MALTKMAMRIALFAVAFVAVFQSQITVDAQPLTALTIPEILSDQRNANQVCFEQSSRDLNCFLLHQ